ncbi:MAG: hypothetical protein LBO67_00035 [Spirochaetaceae bacterium]|jgi:hypothetical protein|nr:hypothetical protein [Spirochaetaceae bacterium]
MRILEIKELVRKDVPIYYRMYYSGIAVIELVNKTVELRLDFSIETKPTGKKDILLTIAQPIDYPVVPFTKAIKQFILELDNAGSLPPL